MKVRNIIVGIVATIAALAPAAALDSTTRVTWDDSWQGTAQEQTWDCLLALGYRGNPDDRSESLYPTQRDRARCQS
jgi:hypothetical protein